MISTLTFLVESYIGPNAIGRKHVRVVLNLRACS